MFLLAYAYVTSASTVLFVVSCCLFQPFPSVVDAVVTVYIVMPRRTFADVSPHHLPARTCRFPAHRHDLYSPTRPSWICICFSGPGTALSYNCILLHHLPELRTFIPVSAVVGGPDPIADLAHATYGDHPKLKAGHYIRRSLSFTDK
ncbi:hypothetical protein C8T65DRAFT_69 [Cerioporus squamosus]|nr:hypothetical protein C8T65DRAFT_69 [Cerioporus squamosus]